MKGHLVMGAKEAAALYTDCKNGFVDSPVLPAMRSISAGLRALSASCASTTISYVMLIEKRQNARVSHGVWPHTPGN